MKQLLLFLGVTLSLAGMLGGCVAEVPAQKVVVRPHHRHRRPHHFCRRVERCHDHGRICKIVKVCH